MPTEQERPGMFARPQKAASNLHRGPTYDLATTARASARNRSVSDVTDPNEQNHGLSQRRRLVPKSRLMGRVLAASSADLQLQVSANPDILNGSNDRAEHHIPGVLDTKQQHAEPLRSHPVTVGNTKSQNSHHGDKANTQPSSPQASAERHTIESVIPPSDLADSPIVACSTESRAPSVELSAWNMVYKGPVVLCPTPPPAPRDDELFLGTNASVQERGSWSQVPTYPAEVTNAESVAKSLSADIVDWDGDEDVLKKENAPGKVSQVPGFQPLALHLPEGPSLYEEIFGRPSEQDCNTRSSGERVADNLVEYSKYTGWIKRK